MVVQRDGMGVVPTGEPGRRAVAERYSLIGEHGMRVQLCSYGARVVSILAPDRRGVLDDVVMGFESVSEYISHRDFFWGCVLGRVAGRLINSECMCLDQCLTLLPNLGLDHYNGGFKGFDNVVWESSVEGDNEVVFSLMSEAPEEGYPCSVLAQASYSLVKGNELRLRLSATCTAPTPLALAHTLPINLAGHGSTKKGLMEHNLAINATKYFLVDENEYPTDLTLVEGTPLDFRTRHLLKKAHPLVPLGGFRHTMAYTEAIEHGPHFVARLHHERSGRCLEVRSDLPCVRVDSMRWLPPPPGNLHTHPMPDTAKRRRCWPEFLKRPKPDIPDVTTYRASPLSDDLQPDRWFMKLPGKTVEDYPPLPMPVPSPRKIVPGRNGTFYWRHGGILIQPMHFPDTLDHRYLPSYTLMPGEIYTQNIWYRFYCKPHPEDLRKTEFPGEYGEYPDEEGLENMSTFEEEDWGAPTREYADYNYDNFGPGTGPAFNF